MKKLISIVLCAVMFLSVVSAAVPVFAATASGTCGDDLAWSFDASAGKLTVTGSGDMTQYSSASLIPWYQYRQQIKAVSLTSDVTYVMSSAFSMCSSLTYNEYGKGKYIGNDDNPYVMLTGLSDNGGSTAYEIHEDTKIIADWVFGDSRVKDLEIPSGVVWIGEGAFANTRLANVTVPAGLKKLSNTAFSNCTKLTTLVLPEGLEEIGRRAFYKCSRLTTLILSSSVTSIGDSAFFGCSSLTDIYYGGSEDDWNAIDIASDMREFFSGVSLHFNSVCGAELIWSLSDGVLSINGRGAMANYDLAANYAPWYDLRDRITTLTVSSDATSIGDGAFYGLENLTEVFIPAGVSSIGKNAFSGCSSLTAVDYSGTSDEWNSIDICEGNDELLSAERVSADAGTCGEQIAWIFYFDSGKLDIIGLGDMTEYASVYDIPWFDYRDRVKTLNITDGVTSIPDNAFSGFVNLEDVSVPNSIERLGTSAISGGSKTNYATYGNLKYLGNASDPYLILIGVTGETKASYTINDGTKFILNSVFGDCTRFNNITIPDGVVSIGNGIFANCPKLTSVNIPASVTSLGSNLFPSCTALASVTVDPDNPVYRSDGNCIIERATGTIISGCSASVIPDDGTIFAIGDSAFTNSQKLPSVTIPDSVTYIGSNAFYYCRSLTEIVIPDSVRTIGDGAFARCEGITSITIPESITGISQKLFEACTSLESVVLPVSVKSVGPSAFGSCTAFKNVLYAGTEEQFEKIAVDNKSGNNFDFLNATVIYNYSGFGPGETVVWKFGGGILTIMGVGEMTDYETPEDAPWYDKTDSITYVEIQSGITSVSANAFAGAENLVTVRIPATLESIGENAFADCPSIERVYTGAYDAENVTVAGGNSALYSAAWYYATDEYYIDTSEIMPFANSKNNFGTAYNVSDVDFTHLCEYVRMIYKDDENKASGVINGLQSLRESEWKGSCYGMAVVTLLDRALMIAFNENFSDASTMSEVDVPNGNAAVESAINYYHISQKIPYVKGANHTTYYNTRSDWKTGLRELVMKAEEGEPMLFCYGFGSSAHAIVIKGYREGSDGSHEVIAYDNRRPAKDTVVKIDKNFNTCVVNGTEDCKYIEFTVDMSCFNYIDIDGPDNDYDNFTYNTNPNGASSEDNAEITIKAIGKVTVKNAEGETLIFEDGNYYGTMTVEDSFFCVEGDDEEQNDNYTFTYTVPNSASFTFTPENSALYVSVLSSDIYASSDTDGASTVFISKDTVKALGDSFKYTLSLSINDEVCDMVSIAGNTMTAVELKNKDGVIKAEGVDTATGEVKVYSNTVNVETYSYLPGYTSFVIEEKSSLAGDVRIMGQSSGGGAYDVDIGRRTSDCAHVWDINVTAEPTYTSDGEAIYTCLKCGETKTVVLPRIISDIKGDVDGDGQLGVKDLLMLRKTVAGLISLDAAASERADVKGDGRVNLKDVLALRRALAGS